MSPIAVNASNLVLGPCTLYAAQFGAVEPDPSTVTPNGYTVPPDPAVWRDVGGTDGGVTLAIENSYTDLSVDQIIMAVGSRLTESKMSVEAKLSEMTLENFQLAINQIGVQTSGAGYNVMEIPVGTSATQPKYVALCIDGWAPESSGGMPQLRRVIVRKVLSQVKASLVNDKKTQQSFDSTFTAYYVSDSVNPVRLIDEDD